MDYLERVKQYVNLKDITSRDDLNVRLTKEGLLGKHRQYRQINIISKELDLSVRGKKDDLGKYTKQTFYRKTYNFTIYRDKKTGRFMKKPKEE